MEKIFNYIDGTLREPKSGQYLDNYDPSVGAVYSLLPDSDQRDVAEAVAVEAGTEFGRRAKSVMDGGGLVSDEIMVVLSDRREFRAELVGGD